MGVNEFSQLITTVGFPIVMCGCMMYYIMKSGEQHKEETDALKDSITNNTIVLTKLCEKIEENFKKGE